MIPFLQLKLTSVNPHLAEVRARAFSHAIFASAKTWCNVRRQIQNGKLFLRFFAKNGGSVNFDPTIFEVTRS
jgi:hypothetical protein